MTEPNDFFHDNLIVTKLSPPVVTTALVERADALAMLKDSLNYPLTTVTAPAGFGKTTLVQTWFNTLKHSRGWLSLDIHDSDLARFMGYLLGTFRSAHPSLGASLTSSADSDEAIIMLTRDLMRYGKPVMLVLDDLHVLHDPDCYAFLQKLIDYQPSNLHLILISREETRLSLARLRGHGQLLDIRADVLRFSGDEAKALICEILGLSMYFPDECDR